MQKRVNVAHPQKMVSKSECLHYNWHADCLFINIYDDCVLDVHLA